METIDKPANFLASKVKWEKSLPDSISIQQELQQIIDQLYDLSYIEASVDSLLVEEKIILAKLYVGNAYQWAQLKNGNIKSQYLEEVRFKEKSFQKGQFSFKSVRKVQEELLSYMENNGFPFAKVWLDDIEIAGQNFSASLYMEEGALILFDKINIEGDASISKSYLEQYLGIRKGQVYDRSKILRVRDRLRELPFVTIKRDPLVSFKGDKADLNLFIDKKRASQFDFIVGVLPNNNESGRLLITGTFEGEFQNQFGVGERIYASFEQLRPQTQELELQFNYPYALNLPFGADLKFNLYKRDTSYLDLEYDIGIQYLLEGGNYFKVFWNNRSTTLLTIDEATLVRTSRLPQTLDVSNASFGLEWVFQQLDYRFNPRKGWNIMLRAAAGIKRIKRNSRVEELNFGELYDTLQLRTFQYKLDGVLEGYLPLFNRSTLKAGLRSGYIFSEQPIYFNEQYRIGGNRILRGFDEESLFATAYAVGTLEYRFLIGQNSYLYTFGDYAYVLNRTPIIDDSDLPYGFGAGITFETRVGVFGVSMAYGSQQGNGIDFGAPKVHFGYVSLF